MKAFDLEQAAKAVGGTVKGKNVKVSGVFTDTRKPVPGGLFIALTGERFDGHAFVPSLEEGETAAVLIGKQIVTSLPAVIVSDTGKALCRLAAWHRARFDIPVIALTGSVGKTTTKEMIAVVLSRTFNTLKTEGNLNNNIGMPLTLLRLDDDVQAAVIEMGMNHAGELSLLTSICRPTAALITNVGVNHIENLGSRENILKAKLEILEGLEKGSKVFLNADNDMLGKLELPDFEVIRYGLDGDEEFTARDVRADPEGSSFILVAHGEEAPVRLNSPGIHNVSNALAAAAVGWHHGVPVGEIAAALADYVPTGRRQRTVKYGGVTLIDDCYNASPTSTKASLEVLAGYGGRRIAILGDMLELGSFSEDMHKDVGAFCKGRADLLFAFGPLSRYTAEAAAAKGVEARTFDDAKALADAVRPVLADGDTVLVKGSRGMHMENIISELF